MIVVIIVVIYCCSVDRCKKDVVQVDENPVYGVTDYDDKIYLKDTNNYYDK